MGLSHWNPYGNGGWSLSLFTLPSRGKAWMAVHRQYLAPALTRCELELRFAGEWSQGLRKRRRVSCQSRGQHRRPCLVAKKKYIIAIMKDSNPTVMGEEAGKLGYEKRACTPVWSLDIWQLESISRIHVLHNGEVMNGVAILHLI